MTLHYELLFGLCCRHKWFTNGDSKQYDMLFDRNREGASLETLATIIWICSTGYTEDEILSILKKEKALCGN